MNTSKAPKAPQCSSFPISIVRGREEILKFSSLLEQFAEGAGYPESMRWLDFFLGDARISNSRRPCLVMVMQSGTDQSIPSLQNLLGAVLFVEYHIFGWRTGIFIPSDALGIRNAVALEGYATTVVATAIEALMQYQGAYLALTSYETATAVKDTAESAFGHDGIGWAHRERSFPKYLRLLGTFEETLHSLGKATRFNMRYYRRRLAKRMQCEFVPDARSSILDPEEISRLNTGSLNVIEHERFRLRWERACTDPSGFMVGLKNEHGEWLSFIGGWRHETTTVLHWQVNAAGYEKDSLSTVMRSYFIEYEIERGAQRLIIDGGTKASLIHSFVNVRVVDMVAKKKSFLDLRFLLTCFMFEVAQIFLGRIYFILEVLGSGDLIWHAGPISRSKPGRQKSGTNVVTMLK